MSAPGIAGSCHCGAVRYLARLDPATPTLRCNCSICGKSRAWIVPIPAGDFELQSGEAVLSEYRFGPRAIVHCFCSVCGVKTHGQLPGPDPAESLVAVSVATLELPPSRLAALPVTFLDGRSGAFDRPPELTSYL